MASAQDAQNLYSRHIRHINLKKIKIKRNWPYKRHHYGYSTDCGGELYSGFVRSNQKNNKNRIIIMSSNSRQPVYRSVYASCIRWHVKWFLSWKKLILSISIVIKLGFGIQKCIADAINQTKNITETRRRIQHGRQCRHQHRHMINHLKAESRGWEIGGME